MKPSNPPPKPKEYSLLLLGKPYAVRKKVFDRKEFLIPRAGKNPTRAEAKNAAVHTPVTEMDVLIFGSEKVFNDISLAFDAPKLTITMPGAADTLSLKELQAKALEEFALEAKANKAYDLFTIKHLKQHYSDLVDKTKKALLVRFRDAFSQNEFEPPLSPAKQGMGHKADVFSHNLVWAPESSIATYKALARQGHVYSQYLAGLLLAMPVGGHSPSCISYLLMAHKNKHPKALGVLAEYLLFQDDYLGAVQCALLSIEGGNRDAYRVIKHTFGINSQLVVNLPSGMTFGTVVLLHDLHETGFDSLLQEHCPDLAPSKAVSETLLRQFLR
ncbi:hypothetical protein [Pseudomonas sp. S1(2024)]|uniref:hypothetical protein n=1 Tax=Pseudomonas sp. S1(2024) TaxID=3390191 RepID=UPI00397B1926